ncbi:diaminopimelate decarboxylase [Texcoconibacillus texcoconensis]|uniref:Diaminopimelate decarboxylase n=1 Tax=Texcoconibacillus texcoconensis TaxID=1095777 RepID=A0A840QNL5_9BACI|nr:diaminopimelate decarboxylase [Texcoconibacillus texcoconensis]MBB5172976.1 diaminopimelate decarboxylase [Texcoconibacillus texcoconensis]
MSAFSTHTVNEKGHIQIGGVDVVELSREYGTPLYVYDVEDIKQRMVAFKEAFDAEGVSYQIAYASKAFSCIAIIQLMKEYGMSLDVVSGGELYTALHAGFPPEQIHFHGNNKLPEEIEFAVKSGVGCFVVDNFYELDLLNEILKNNNRTMDILLRITPGVEAHTHDYISTGQEDSKFGFDINSGQADLAIEKSLASQYLQLQGFHSHIGSQIFEEEGFILAVEAMVREIKRWNDKYANFTLNVLNVGGGFGIRYTQDDAPLSPGRYVSAIVQAVREQMGAIGLPVPEIWIEPGRALVGEAGTTLYTIGSVKDIPNVRKYVSVDGGMTDNIRPALYEAEYEADVANRMNDARNETVSIAGKCCESGDMLIWDIALPSVQQGDILAVYSTGAYGYSMANNYNRIERPGVVFVENGQAQLVVKRETYEDLLKQDLRYQSQSNCTSVHLT